MPIERVSSPRNGVERAISVMSSPSSALPVRCDQFCGAEWWIQDVAADEPPKVFHTDCDVQTNIEGDGDGLVTIHPAVASVLYLGDDGGATAVFGQAKRRVHAASLGTQGEKAFSSTVLRPRLPVEVAVVHPRRNRLLLFEGDRYHAVLHPSPSPTNTAGQRVGFLSFHHLLSHVPHRNPDVSDS